MKREKKKGSVWYGLRIAFALTILFWFSLYLFDISSYPTIESLVILAWIAAGVTTFVMSIVHLTKYKNKALPITALVISSILVLLFSMGAIIGVLEGLQEDYPSSNIEEYVDVTCHNFCFGIKNVKSYDYQYNENTDKVDCFCLSENNEIVIQKEIII
jgi:hypothetical protein